jgi:hypothetical protein
MHSNIPFTKKHPHSTMPRVNPIIPFLLNWFLLCMIIAIPCLLCGESDTLHIKSYSMRKYIGVVVNNHIFESTSNIGRAMFNGICYYKYDGDKICKIREYYQRKYRRHSNADDDNGITKPAAIVEIDMRCPINSTRTVYDIRNGECNIINSYEDIANVGFTFMLFGGIILIIIAIVSLDDFIYSRRVAQIIQYNQITPSTESNTASHVSPKILFENITIEKAQECMICLETNNVDWVKTVCGHEFHRKCIVDSSKYRLACPECRQNMFDYKTTNLKVTPTPPMQHNPETIDEKATNALSVEV